MTTKASHNRRSSGSIKILNDQQIPPQPAANAPTKANGKNAAKVTPTKSMNVSIAKVKKSPQTNAKEMDHYVLQTIKNETKDEDGGDLDDDEMIDFILADAEEELQLRNGAKSGEITEELLLSGEEDDEDEDGGGEEGDEKVEEILEHMCGKCYKTFRRLSGLQKHLDFCRYDAGYHLRKAEMLKNLEKIEKDAIIMENKDVCFCCGETYDTCHLGHINCPDCPKSFKSQTSYERHIFITHSEFNEYPCNVCNGKLRSANLLKLHEEQHQNRGKPYACKICGKDFTRPYHLKRHQKYSSCSANESDAMNCKVCNKAFFRLDNLRAHLKQHLGTQITKKPEYMCPICKNCFYSLSTLNIHTRTHTGERPFDCDLCDKKFPSLVALKKHRRYHTGEKPYTCSVCNQCFAVKEVLNRHMKRHTGERPHVCSECGKSFIQATQLRSHIRTHLRPFECEDCDEKFKTGKQLERHAKTHSSGRAKGARKTRKTKELRCVPCNMVFRRREDLRTHLYSNLPGHPVPGTRRRERTDCAICDRNFDTAKSLQFHILKVHEIDPTDFVNEKPPDTDEERTAEEVPLPPGSFKFEGDLSEISIISNNKDAAGPTTRSAVDCKASVAGNEGGGIVVQEFIVDEISEAQYESSPTKQTIILENEAFTVIPLDGMEAETSPTRTAAATTPNSRSSASKKAQRKSLAASLAAAIADDPAVEEGHDSDTDSTEQQSAEDLKLKANVAKLLDMLVDETTLKKFGWPRASEEEVLYKVIGNCGYDLTKDEQMLKSCDYMTRMREYVKLLFTVVVHNEPIKDLLNNYTIDEVIEYVLGSEDGEDVDMEGADDDEIDGEAGSEKEEEDEEKPKTF